MVLRRRTVNVRASKARQVNYAGHGQNEDWHARAPSDEEYWQRAENMRWYGLNARVSYWLSNNDWFGFKGDPTAPDQFATNRPDYGGVWHITLGRISWLNPNQHKQLQRLQAKFATPQRMLLHSGRSNAKGPAPLFHTDPLASDPLVQSLNVMGRDLHVTM